MAFDNNDFDMEPEPEAVEPAPEEGSNRPFWIAVGVMAAIFLLCLVGLAALVFTRPLWSGTGNANRTEAAAINQQNTEIALSVARTQEAKSFTATPSATLPPTATLVPPTKTPVVVAQVTNTPIGGSAARTATVSALLTLAATSQQTKPTATQVITSTALPESGIADAVGAPGMLALAMLLVGIIFLARRLRASI